MIFALQYSRWNLTNQPSCRTCYSSHMTSAFMLVNVISNTCLENALFLDCTVLCSLQVAVCTCQLAIIFFLEIRYTFIHPTLCWMYMVLHDTCLTMWIVQLEKKEVYFMYYKKGLHQENLRSISKTTCQCDGGNSQRLPLPHSFP